MNLSLKEKGNRKENINDVIGIFNHNCYALGSERFGISSYLYEGSGLFIFPAYFNHSCDPNTYRFTIGDIFILIASRDIKKIQKFVRYISEWVKYMKKGKNMLKNNMDLNVIIANLNWKIIPNPH